MMSITQESTSSPHHAAQIILPSLATKVTCIPNSLHQSTENQRNLSCDTVSPIPSHVPSIRPCSSGSVAPTNKRSVQIITTLPEPPNSPSSSLNPGAPIFTPKSSKSNQRTRSKGNKSTYTAEQAELESLKVELAFTKTKIVDLENSKREAANSLKIYEQKLKILENERLNVLKEQYFPSQVHPSTLTSHHVVPQEARILCKCRLQSQITELSCEVQRLSSHISSLDRNIFVDPKCSQANATSNSPQPGAMISDCEHPLEESLALSSNPTPTPGKHIEDNLQSESSLSDFEYAEINLN